MNYKKIYDDLILYRKKNLVIKGYFEKHHIIPRSLGGSNNKENIVALTAREHYIAHLLLARFNNCNQTIYALWMMRMKTGEKCDRPYIKNARMYEWARKEFIKYISSNNTLNRGERNSQYGTQWICNIELKENRKINKGEPILHGWVYGRNIWNIIEREEIKKEKAKNYSCKNGFKPGNISHVNRIWVNDGAINKVILKTDPLPENFKIGRLNMH